MFVIQQMNKPIDNLMLTVQNRKVTDFSIYDKTPAGPLVFKKINSGSNKGFYQSIPNVIKHGKPLVYTKAFFDQPLKYLYKDYLPFYDGFYYIPKSEIPIKKLIYGLQNYDMPTSGNIETYIKSFNHISVPTDFCPLIDPCIYDWCDSCEQQRIINTQKYKIQNEKKSYHYFYFFITIFFLSLIATLAFGL
jgi:hypothetical protein